jgi:hypothetical protein
MAAMCEIAIFYSFLLIIISNEPCWGRGVAVGRIVGM